MRASPVLIAGLFLASSAWAHNCPNEMKAIDAKLATHPKLSKEQMEKVTELRKKGEEEHRAGKHDASMKDLGEAKKILGM